MVKPSILIRFGDFFSTLAIRNYIVFENPLWTLSGNAIIRVGGEWRTFLLLTDEKGWREIRWMGNSGEGISTPVIDWTSWGSCDLLKGTVFFVNRRGVLKWRHGNASFFPFFLFWPKSFKGLKWHRRGTWLRALLGMVTWRSDKCPCLEYNCLKEVVGNDTHSDFVPFTHSILFLLLYHVPRMGMEWCTSVFRLCYQSIFTTMLLCNF